MMNKMGGLSDAMAGCKGLFLICTIAGGVVVEEEEEEYML